MIKEKLSLRKILKKDKKILFYWFNDKESIKYKLRTTNKISFNSHTIWFNKNLFNRKSLIWIIKINKQLIGQIRFSYIANYSYEIDIFLSKEYRGRGIASNALKKAETFLEKKTQVISTIKKNNINSYKFFKKNSFFLTQDNKNYWKLNKIIR